MTAWSDDPGFWEAMEPALCAGARLARAEGDVAGIDACVALRPAARVLDLACGPGAHAIAFAHRGHRVTGVDTSSRLLARARAAAAGAGAPVEWVEADMREFRRPAAFDLVCSLYSSFGYFDDQQNRCVLENVRESLAPGGTLVLDVLGREAAIRHAQGRRVHEVEGVEYREHSAVADAPSRLVSDWGVVRGGVRRDFRVTQRLYSASELRELLLSVGFASVRLAGGLDGKAPYDEVAERLVAVARRRPSR
jgi:SAM-dependent methyltransferase